MGEIIIDYSEINSAAKKARSASGYFEDFEEELEKKVSKKLSGLPGSDSKGNIGNAKSIVSSKIKENLGKRRNTILIWLQASKSLRITLSMKRKVLLPMLDTLQPRRLS